MSKYLEELGKVSEVFLGYEDHGILTMLLDIDFGGSGQGFGGMILSTHDEKSDKNRGTVAGTDLICRMLDLFHVRDLQKIKGRYVIALREKPMGNIVGLRMPKVDGDREFIVADWRSELELRELRQRESQGRVSQGDADAWKAGGGPCDPGRSI